MAAAAAGQQQRGPVPEQTAPAAGTNGGYYALVIGINRYPSSDMPALYTAERDADAMAAVLGQSYGFQVQELTGAKATRANILRALTGYRKTLKEDDSLLIYFAGHGTRDVDVSYWLPYDADMSSNANWVSASDITSGMKGQPARHVLVISDSCYSGGLSRDVKLGLRPADKTAYLSKMLTGRSRTLMESGGLEPVSDGAPNGHSVFADAILDALQRPEIDVISAEDLFYGYIKERVAGSSKQTPEYDVIYDSGHREGDFVFVRVKTALVESVPTPTVDKQLSDAPAQPITTLNNQPATGKSAQMVDANLSFQKGAELYRKGQFEAAFAPLSAACDGKIGAACRALASPNYQTDRPSFDQRGCTYGDVQSCWVSDLLVGSKMEKGIAASFYKKQCDGGDAAACGLLGMAYSLGEGLVRDPSRAVDYKQQACEGGSIADCNSLGRSYLLGDKLGEPVKRDYAKAIKLFRMGCD